MRGCSLGRWAAARLISDKTKDRNGHYSRKYFDLSDEGRRIRQERVCQANQNGKHRWNPFKDQQQSKWPFQCS